jgi:RHS repeat-associated protein
MAVVNYTTVNGRILHEDRGGVKTLFMPDTLGNVIETRNMDTGAQTSSTTYWPYGEVRTQTGTNPSPFGFCGVWGYYTQAGQPTYVRARYYRPHLGRWQTVDPLWPSQCAYSYSAANPISVTDPTGQEPPPPGYHPPCTIVRQNALRELSRCFSPADASNLSDIFECLAYAESNCDSSASRGGRYEPEGLFQIGCHQFDACIDRAGCAPCAGDRPRQGCGIYDMDCQLNAMTNLAVYLAFGPSAPGGRGGSIENALCGNFGVLDCERPKRRRQNEKFYECLRKKGKLDLIKRPFPRPKEGAGCGCKKSPTHQ